jgi:hypothetical protein
MAGALSAPCQAGKKPAVVENGSYVAYDLRLTLRGAVG